jgi:hypothetical protein
VAAHRSAPPRFLADDATPRLAQSTDAHEIARAARTRKAKFEVEFEFKAHFDFETHFEFKAQFEFEFKAHFEVKFECEARVEGCKKGIR